MGPGVCYYGGGGLSIILSIIAVVEGARESSRTVLLDYT